MIVNENNFPLNAFSLDNNFIDASIDHSLGKFIYELKILNANNSNAPVFIDVLPGEEFKIGLETGSVEFKRNREGGSFPLNGTRGMHGGNNRGGMRRNNQNVKSMIEPIKIWIDAKLSKN